MKININKELLLKHRFWIMLGAAALVILIGLFYLQFSVDAASETSKLKKALTAAAMTKPPFKNQPAIDSREKDAKNAQDKQRTVWAECWKPQYGLFEWPWDMASWPKDIERPFNFLSGKFITKIESISASPKDVKSWPKDEDHLMHGVYVGLEGSSIEVRNAKGANIQFFRNKKMELNGVDLKNLDSKKVLAITYQTGRYFNDPLPGPEQAAFKLYYKSQIRETLKIVEPLNERYFERDEPLDDRGRGVVQLKDWIFNTRDDKALPDEKMPFIRYVTKEWNDLSDFSDEAWIAQENLWLQQDIYRCIRKANDSISVFAGQGGKKRNETYRFKNSYFELELSLDQNGKLTFKISNMLPKPQRLDLNFRVLMNDKGSSELIKVSGPRLEAHIGDPKKRDKKSSFVAEFEAKKESPRNGIYAVKQVLTWENAAVKRIDHISLGSADSKDISHSQRTLSPLLPFKKVAEPAPNPNAAPAGGRPAPGAKAADPVVGVNKKILDHGLWTDRYYDVSEQARRVPVCVVLIVDQDHVDRVLTAFNNSKLRFLMTQVLLNQHMGSLQPKAPAAENKEQAPGVPPRGGVQPAAPVTTSGGDADVNMELVIYGIMTMYERFPPKPK
jgi:hypothetical protein